jgi:nitrite reductase/ring-hydroxylating ferredoxin subunit
MNREEFLKSMCPTFGLAIVLSSAALESCSKTEEEPTPAVDPQYEALLNKTLTNGFFVEGTTLYMNVQKGIYTELKTIGNFVNDQGNGLLIVRKDANTIVVFDNCCPHQGTRNAWSFSNNRFTCGNHGYTFGTDKGQIAPCNSNSPFGNLKSYTASFTKDLITVQLA